MYEYRLSVHRCNYLIFVHRCVCLLLNYTTILYVSVRCGCVCFPILQGPQGPRGPKGPVGDSGRLGFPGMKVLCDLSVQLTSKNQFPFL